MNSLPEASINCLYGDPPYNLQLQQDLDRPDGSHVDAVRDNWDQFDSLEHYQTFTEEWLTAAQRVLKPSGTIFVQGSYHNIYTVGYVMQKLGYWFLNDIVWIKTNPMPHMRGVRLCNAHETLIWAKKSQKSKGYTFNYQDMKTRNGGTQLRSDWKFNICQGSERLKKEDGTKAHSTQKPFALMEQIVLAATSPGDVVLEPFAGTATFCAASKTYGRHFIGIDNELTYVDLAQERLAKIA
jgi:modification methylase